MTTKSQKGHRIITSSLIYSPQDVFTEYSGLIRVRARLADGLERRCFGARVLGYAVAHAGHAVARRAQAVALAIGVGAGVARPEPLEGGAHLRLTADDDEDEDALGGVAEVRHVPEEVRTAGHPRDHVEDPRHAHHHHELQADLAESGPATERGEDRLINSSRILYVCIDFIIIVMLCLGSLYVYGYIVCMRIMGRTRWIDGNLGYGACLFNKRARARFI